MSRNSTHINCNQVAGTVNQGIWKNDCDPCATSPFAINNISVWHRFNFGVNNNATPADILAAVADGAGVTQWDDQIGSNDAEQTTSADEPTWFATDTSHKVIAGNHFDLSSAITYAAAADFTVLIAYVPLINTTPSGQKLWDKADGSNWLKWNSTTEIEVKINGVVNTVTGPAIQLSDYTNFVVRRCSGIVQLFIAGVPWGASFVDNGSLVIERLGPDANGYIAAHMQFTRCLTDKEIWCLDCYNSNQSDEENPVTCNIGDFKLACNGNTNGSLTATMFNATGTVTYLWSPGGQTTQTITGQGAGTYTCTLTDSASPANVCTASGAVTEPPALACTVTGINPQYILNSAGQQILTTGSVSAVATGGYGAGCTLTYAWTRNGSAISNANGGIAAPGNVASFNVAENGVYAVTITDCYGCTTTCNVTITIPNPPSTLDIECCYEAAGCTDADVKWAIMLDSTATFPCTITASGSTSGTASWSPVTVSSLPANTSIDGSQYDMFSCESSGPWHYGSNAQKLAPGETWTLTVTDSSSPARSQTCSVNIVNPPALALTTQVTQPTMCEAGGTVSDGDITFNGSGGNPNCNPWTYSITGPNSFSTTNNYVLNAAPGTYTLTVTDACGCSATQNVTLTCPITADMTVTNTDVSCRPVQSELNPNPQIPCDATATFTASPTSVTGYTFTAYLYDPSGVLIHTEGPHATFNAATVTGLCIGNYTWTYFATNTSSGLTYQVDSGSFTVVAPPALSATTVANFIHCFGGSTGTIDLTPSGGTPGYTYLWTAGATGTVPSGQSTNQDLTGLVYGVYFCTITDANGCTVTISQSVNQVTCPLTIYAVVPEIPCPGQTTSIKQLYITCGTGPYTYAWVASNGGSLGSNSATGDNLAGIGAGTYTVTVTDDNGCTGTQAWTVVAPSAISGSITGTNIACKGERSGAAQFDQWADQQFSGATYLWTTDAGFTTPNPYGPSNNSYISSVPAGTYYLQVTLSNGCIWTGSIVITEPGTGMSLSAVITDENQCTDCCGAIDLTVTGGSAPYTFQWNDPAASTTEDLSCVPAGSYTVIVTDDAGCTATATYTVGVTYYQLTIGIAYDNTTGQFTTTVGGGNPAYYYQWTKDGNPFSYAQDPFSAGNGYYCVTVTDSVGCTGTACYDLSREPRGEESFNCQTYTPTTGVTAYGCVSVAGTGGTYSTLAACQAACEVERPTRYRCQEGTGCVQHPGGTYTSLSACNAVCGASGQNDINYVCQILCSDNESGERYKTTDGRVDTDERGNPVREDAGTPGGKCREENSETDSSLTKYTTFELCKAACPWCKEGTYKY